MTDRTQSLAADRRGERHLIRVGLLIAAALMLSLVFLSTSARAAESDPTIVLVHGAFASPAGWDGVAARLHKHGYQTATPALGLASVSDDVAIVRSTLDSIALLGTPSGPAAWHALPSWYAVSAHDRAIDPALQRFMAKRAGSRTVRFAAASHVGGLTHYKARFVKLIEQAVKATAN